MSKHPFLPSLEARSAVNSAVDCDVVAIFQDNGKKAIAPTGPNAAHYAAMILKFRKSEAFAARAGAVQFVRFGGVGLAESVAFVGTGSSSELTEEGARKAGGAVWSKLCAEKISTAAIHIDTLFEVRGVGPAPIRIARAFAEGLILGAYQFNKHRSKASLPTDPYAGPSKLVFVVREKSFRQEFEAELAQIASVGQAVTVTRDWSNEPSNHGTPEHFAQEARRIARAHGLKCRVLTEADAKREKMGLFLGVGQGSEVEGRIVIVEYAPKAGKASKTKPKNVILVGKGVTFDSGGISIKPSLRMEEMKHDMTGAATVMGAVLLAAEWKVPNHVVGIMAFTENMPDGNAIQPGNVLTARNGKTVEIINTDAEGRLVLGDALDFAQDMKPDALIDVATLTGAVAIALGKQCCAVLGNEDSLIEAIQRAGELNGERIWQLPLYDEYFEDLKSDCADMKNSANNSYGGTIRGAIFLKQFIRKGTSWAHLDIAATSTEMGHLGYLPKKGASGLYVRTLAQFAADF
jgi:leucyl aminopeptidase